MKGENFSSETTYQVVRFKKRGNLLMIINHLEVRLGKKNIHKHLLTVIRIYTSIFQWERIAKYTQLVEGIEGENVGTRLYISLVSYCLLLRWER